ncbi:MAG TPA: hypothetical protein VGQ89_03640 [Candidatus Limnocylindrales bacterium]|nr:hypothetical protein [Candidatus Limnocylindrales bacterium]
MPTGFEDISLAEPVTRTSEVAGGADGGATLGVAGLDVDGPGGEDDGP